MWQNLSISRAVALRAPRLCRLVMRQFLQEYWWYLFGFAALAVFIGVQERRDRFVRQSSTVLPRSFGAIRGLTTDDLRPFFGTYLPSARDKFAYAVVVAFLAALAAAIAYSIDQRTSVVVVSVAGIIAIAIFVVSVDARTERVIGPSSISYKSPFSVFSWSVPLSEILQCDLIPGGPVNRLRLILRTGNRVLPLTSELWRKLRSA